VIPLIEKGKAVDLDAKAFGVMLLVWDEEDAALAMRVLKVTRGEVYTRAEIAHMIPLGAEGAQEVARWKRQFGGVVKDMRPIGR
jgi:hypothetical protein